MRLNGNESKAISDCAEEIRFILEDLELDIYSGDEEFTEIELNRIERELKEIRKIIGRGCKK